MKKLSVLILFFFFSIQVFCGNYFISCKKMPNAVGSWSIDDTGTMCASSKGNSVSGEYEIPESGTCYVWLRSCSFGQNWRKFSVSVNGKNLGKAGDEVFPDSKGKKPRTKLLWARLPKSIALEKGKTSICVTSETGYSRLSALAITDDPNFVPPDSEDKLAAMDELVSTIKKEFAGLIKFKVDLDKPMISYKVNEPVVFTIQAFCNDKAVESGFIKYRLRADYGFDEEKLVPCDGKPLKVSVTLDKPGFVRLQAELLDSNKNATISDDGNRPVFNGGAGVEIDKIPSLPEPADFDAFWARQRAKLQAVPLQAKITGQGTSDDGKFEYFSVSAPCPGSNYKGEAPRPMTGIFSKPAGVAPGTLKARLYLPGYGGRGGERTRCETNSEYIIMSINAHGMDIGREREYYDKFEASRAGYAMSDGADPENCYFNGMVLRVLRALEFLRSLPEWNGVDLEVRGPSQGGLQSLWAAGLDDKVTFCEARIPWACNMGETTLGLMGRDRVMIQYAPGREYYDPVNFAKRIKCPVDISRASMGDYTSPPSGVARVYFNLQCPKTITWVQNSEHTEGFPRDAVRIRMNGDQIVK